MGTEQFSQTVRGSGGILRTAATGVVETDNYSHGGHFDETGSNYPVTVDPAETIQELNITSAGDIIAELHTTGGDTIPFPLAGTVGSYEKWELNKVVFKDPNGTQAPIRGGWAGE
jgi:hypothetical protein